jgi:hypothetical protein
VTDHGKSNDAGEFALTPIAGYTPRHFARLFRCSMGAPHVTDGSAPYASTHSGATAQKIGDAIRKNTVATDSVYNKTVIVGRLEQRRDRTPCGKGRGKRS